MIVCHCRAMSDRAIRKAVRDGACTPREVFEVCGASRACGGCAAAICELIEAEIDAPPARPHAGELAATG